MSSVGKLRIKPLQAIIHRNTEFFGLMQPFIQFEFEQQSKNTHISKCGGKNPVWNDLIIFERQRSTALLVTLLDHQTMKQHDLIGTAFVDISHVFAKSQSTTMTVDLFFNGNISAKINLYILFQEQSKQLDQKIRHSLMTHNQFSDNNNQQDSLKINESNNLKIQKYSQSLLSPGYDGNVIFNPNRRSRVQCQERVSKCVTILVNQQTQNNQSQVNKNELQFSITIQKQTSS